MATNPTIKPKRGTTAPGPGSISQNELAVNTVSQSVYIGSVSGSGILVGSAPQGSNTQVQFNSSGVFAGSGNFIFDGSGVNVNGIVSSGLGISTSATTFNIVTNTASTINIGTTSGSTISIGNASGTTTIRNAGTNLNGTLTVTGVSVHQGAGHFNSTLTVTSTSSLIGDVTASGDIAVNGGDITSTATTFNLLNATVTNANVLGASNTVVIGGTGGTATIRNAAININGTLTITGVSVHQGAGSFNSTLSVTGEATFVGSVIANGGTITSSATTFNLLNTTVTNANVLGSANIIVLGGTAGTATIRNAGTNINGTLTITGASTLQGAASLNSNLTVTGAATLQSTLAVGGNTISSASTTFNLLNTTVTNANVLGAADTVVIGSAGGSTTIRNAATRFNGTLTVTGATVIQGALSTNGALSVTGTSTLIGDVTASGDIAVNGGDITSTATTFNLLNSTVTGLNVGGGANTVVLGGTGGTVTIRNAGTNINGTLTVTGNTTTVGDVTVRGGDIGLLEKGGGSDIVHIASPSDVSPGGITYTLPGSYPASSNYVLQSTTTGLMSWAAPASSSSVGITATSASSNYNLLFTDVSATNTSAPLYIDGGTNIQYNPSTDVLTLGGDIAVNGGDITSTVTSFNLLNANVTTLNLAGAAAVINVGASGGDVTVAGNFYAVKKSFLIDHPSKPGSKLEYACLEGPENGVYVRGRLEGKKEIKLPDYWKDLVHADSITVQLTPIGSSDCHYVSKYTSKKITVDCESGKINCFYLVQAERKDILRFEVERKIVK